MVALLRLALGPMPKGMRSLAGQIESGESTDGQEGQAVTTCPCCDRPMDVEPHELGAPWTPDQLALMHKLNGKVKRKVIAAIWGVSGDTITAALRAERKGNRAPAGSSKHRVNPRMLLHRQQAALPAAKQPAMRKCLGCQKPFESSWIGNRLCVSCGGPGAKVAKAPLAHTAPGADVGSNAEAPTPAAAASPSPAAAGVL